MSGVSGEISIGERNPPKWRAAQDFTICRLSILAKEETWLRAAVGVSPAIEHYARNVALGVEARCSEHLCELLAHPPLVIPIRSGEQFGAPRILLLYQRQAQPAE